eukprot:m51a1_g14623 hypothetical protein (451) ;mRNA; f:1234204-1235694
MASRLSESWLVAFCALLAFTGSSTAAAQRTVVRSGGCNASGCSTAGNATLAHVLDRVRVGPFVLPARTSMELHVWPLASGSELDVRQLSVWWTNAADEHAELSAVANSSLLVPQGHSPNITFVVERASAFWILLVHGPAPASTSGNATALRLRWRIRSLEAPNCLCSIGGVVSLAMVAATFVAGIALWVAFAFAIDRDEQEARQSNWELFMFAEVGCRMQGVREAHPRGAGPLRRVLRKPKITVLRAVLCDHDVMWIFSPEPGETIPVGHRIAATVANHMFQFMVYALVMLYRQELGDIIVIEPSQLAGLELNHIIVASLLINVSSFAFNLVYKVIFRWAWRPSRKATACHVVAGVASALFLLAFTLFNTTIFFWVLYKATCSRILSRFVIPFAVFMSVWLAVVCPALSLALYFASARWGRCQDYTSSEGPREQPACCGIPELAAPIGVD